jgi:hypothetical protein
VTDINYETLGRLHIYCQTRIQDLPADFSKVSALAYAYVDFAHENRRAWETVFAVSHKGDKLSKLSKDYKKRLLSLFENIESTLQECLNLPVKQAQTSARLLWACLHGITILTLDGRLKLVGVEQPHVMIDDLLQRCLSNLVKKNVSGA